MMLLIFIQIIQKAKKERRKQYQSKKIKVIKNQEMQVLWALKIKIKQIILTFIE